MSRYPRQYKNKSVKEQWKIIKRSFIELKWTKFPDGKSDGCSEGTFVIPNPSLFGTYNEAVMKVLEALSASRDFYNYRDGRMGERYLRQLPVKEAFWSVQDDVIVLGAQFGMKHAGKSVNAVRDNLEANELPLGAYEVGMMLLTHPERLQSYDDLWIDCPGDEYAPDGDGVFSKALVFFFIDRLGCGTLDLSYALDNYGSASAFLPQPLEARTLDAFEPSYGTSEVVMERDERMYRLGKQVFKNNLFQFISSKRGEEGK